MRGLWCDIIPPPGDELELPPPEAFHAVRVLRARVGDHFRLLDGQGHAAAAVALVAGKRGRDEVLRVRVESRQTWQPPACRLRLCIAPPRAKLWNQLLRDVTELGVARITPLLCEFSVAQPDADSARHWRDDLIQALKQSGNPFLPVLDPPQPFRAVAAGLAGVPGLLGDVTDSATPFALPTPPPAEFAIWVGPEGGFSAAERQTLLDAGVTPLRLGNWILRVETAAPALLGFLLGHAPAACRCQLA